MEEIRIHSYDPVCFSDARILILGTAPSVESLKQGFYYAHPRNAFWPILADVFSATVPQNIDQKKALLIQNQVALWDVVHSCIRSGSLDANIRGAEPNDVPGLIASCPNIRHVLFNGAAAHALYRRFFKDAAAIHAMRMPSTSPAYTLPYAEKLHLWRDALTREAD